MPELTFDMLPGQLKLIARECGMECMWAVWRHYGGTALSVPSAVSDGHPLVSTLGREFAESVCKAFAPKTLYIAKGHGAQLAIKNSLRNRDILADVAAGLGYNKIARKHDLSYRQVINIVNGAGGEPLDNQLDLFDV